ncbi:MAG: RHS repeat-associated core domain-containing protein [Lysobacteraceae bacterium]
MLCFVGSALTRRGIRCAFAVAMLAALSGSAWSQTATTTTIPQEYGKTISSAEKVGSLGMDAFGDNTSLYTGQTSFEVTDVSIPGNNGLSVAVSRRYEVEVRGDLKTKGLFADWELDIPHLEGTFAKATGVGTGWKVSTPSLPNNRCTVSSYLNGEPPPAPGTQGGTFDAGEYWSGNKLRLPGSGTQEMLVLDSGNQKRPTTGGPYYWVTTGQWFFSCLSSTANGASVPGEAFLAIAPDGTKYTFNWFIERPAETLTKSGGAPLGLSTSTSEEGGDAPTNPEETSLVSTQYILHREEIWIMPTQIQDRFGNTVTYTYDPANPQRLTRIESSDGRLLTLQYDTSGRIQSVTNGTRVWQYAYLGGYLDTVTLPDGISTWKYALSSLNSAQVLQTPPGPNGEAPFCESASSSASQSNYTGTITHPSGATGTFVFRPTVHGRSFVPKQCIYPGGFAVPANHAYYPYLFDSISLKTKTITGAGLPAGGYAWTYDYGLPRNSWLQDCPTPASCYDTKLVTSTGPDGFARYTYGNRYQTNEGKLLKVERGPTSASILRSETTTYELNSASKPYPEWIGRSPYSRGDHSGEKLTPVLSRVTTQQGKNFSWTASTFDAYANPLTVTKSSNLPFSRTESYEYNNNTAKWVLGQIKKVTSGGQVASETQFNTNALPDWTKSWGVLQQSFTYNANGTLWKVTDGRNYTTTFASYNRGIPQLITLPTTKTTSAVVNTFGEITSITDPMTFTTGYQYDALGRLTQITPPSGDTTAWSPTIRTFNRVTTTELGIAGTHWRLDTTTGNAKTTTYFDALWRPLVVLEEDTTIASTKRYNVSRYDHAGRTTFSAYPRSTISLYSSVYDGVTSYFDVLGRPTSVVQNSELGSLTTSYAYATNAFTRTVTNPRLKPTTSTFMAWDEPTYDYPLVITQPLSVTTTIARDTWGKPTTITKAGGGASLLRRFVYDANQRLCKRHNPESNWTVFNYDAAGNIDWRADGVTNTTSTTLCQQSSVAAGERTIHTYDGMNRVLTIATANTPVVTDDTVYTYYDDGAVKTATTGAGTASRAWTYSYNKRRLPTKDSLVVDSKTFAIDYTYTGTGAVSTIKYPDNYTAYLAPNALGQPTKVGPSTGTSYASSVLFHPGGQLKSFTYGNTIAFSQTLNTRGLPDQRSDKYGTTSFLNYGYVYDQNGNLVSLVDALGIDNRDMGYDDLDRLTSVDGPIASPTYEGDSDYTYDALDNVKSWTIRPNGVPSTFTYGYDSSKNQLSSISGAATASYLYNNRGEMTTRGVISQQSTHTYETTGRMKTAAGTARIGGSYSESYVYDANGHRTVSTNASSQKRYDIWTRDGQRLYSEDAWDGKKHRFMYLGGRLVAEVKTPIAGGTAVTEYHHTDHLGSAVAKTDVNHVRIAQGENGLGLYRSGYGRLVFGNEPGGPGYAGHIGDTASDLTYMKARYYNNVAMRFTSTDPVDVDPSSGSNFNRYWYARNNPYTFIDPDGRLAETPLVVVVARSVQTAIIADEAIPEPTDAFLPKHAAYLVAFVAAEGLLYYYSQPDDSETVVAPPVTPVEPETPTTPIEAAEHTKGARPSTLGKHQQGKTRREQDRGGEKGDSSRRPPSKRPPKHKGPWPPKPPKPPEPPKKPPEDR